MKRTGTKLNTLSIAMLTFALFVFVGMFVKRIFFAPVACDNTIVVGTNATYKPYCYLDESGAIVGIDIDVAKEVVKRLGQPIKIVDMNFDALLPALQLGSIHIIAAGLTPTAEREKRVSFVRPHLKSGSFVAITKPDYGSVGNLADLAGKNLIVNEGYITEDIVKVIPNTSVLPLDTTSDALLALESGRGDIYITETIAANAALKEQTKLKVALWPLTITAAEVPALAEHRGTALAVSKKYPQLLQQVDDILKQMEHDGTLERIRQQWMAGVSI